MTRTTVAGIVLIAAFVVCGAGWLLLPSLQDAQRTVDAEASVHVERARRLLAQYRPGLAHKSLLLQQLREAGVDIDLADPEALSDGSAADEYQARHERAWETFEPTDWEAKPPRKSSRPGYGNIVRDAQEAARQRDRLSGENEDLLAEAMAEVQVALAVTSGDASASSHAEAARLRGVILFHMGLAQRIEADIKRGEGDPVRRQLVALATQAVAAGFSQALVEDSGIAEQIGSLEAAAAEADANCAEQRETLAGLDKTIEDLDGRLVSAQAQAKQARKAMDELKAAGIDLSDLDGGEAFRVQLAEQDGIYRSALREAQALEFGTYPTARIDGSADYLTGQYVESGETADPTVEYGLTHYRHQQQVLAARFEAKQRGLDDLRADLARLVGIRTSYQAAQDRAGVDLQDSRTKAQEVYTELNRLESEAFAIEERALGLLEQSAKISAQAARYADQWVRDAQSRTSDLDSEAVNRSAYGARGDDGWMGGYIAAQVADARLAKAWILHARYAAYSDSLEVLGAVAEPLRLSEADVEDLRAKVQDARQAGVDEVGQAIDSLDGAYRKVGRHWTIVAQEAGAIYLLALFGHESYVDEAITAYRSALKGREDEQHAERLRARLARLERR